MDAGTVILLGILAIIWLGKKQPVPQTAASGASNGGTESTTVDNDIRQTSDDGGEVSGSYDPQTLNDGTFDYVLVRPERDLGNGVADVALYERVPINADFQYTPDLAFTLGQTLVPIMQPMPR